MRSLFVRLLFAPFALLVVASVGGDAEAKVVASDDGMYSVDLGTVCFVEPRALRVEADCTGIDVGAFPPPAVADPLARIAYGVVRGAGARGVIGEVMLMRAPSHATAPPDRGAAEQVGEETAAAMGAQARPVPGTSKIAWGRNVPVVRSTLVVEPLDGGAEVKHHEVLTAVGNRYLYITVWAGPREHAPDLARLAAAAASTTDLKPQARPIPNLNPWPGRLLFLFGILALLLLRLRKRRPNPPSP